MGSLPNNIARSMDLESLEGRTLCSTVTIDGLTFDPSVHQTLWFGQGTNQTTRINELKNWYSTNGSTPASDDALGNAMAYVATGNKTFAQNAINQLMAFTISSSELNGVASDNYRWNDW